MMTAEEGIVIVCRASMADYAESYLNLSADDWIDAISAGRSQSDGMSDSEVAAGAVTLSPPLDCCFCRSLQPMIGGLHQGDVH